MSQCCNKTMNMIYVLLSTFYIKNGKQRCKFIALGHELTYFVEYGGTQKMMSLLCWSSLHYNILSSLEGTFFNKSSASPNGNKKILKIPKG
jgi:hypothetical protein